MKRWLDRLLVGLILETAFIALVTIAILVFQFYDSFYNRFFFEWVAGRHVLGAGFILGVAIAVLMGTFAETEWGWKFLENSASKIRIMKWVIDFTGQIKVFYQHARKHGLILAPYYRSRSGFWPGAVTNLLPDENDKYLVTVTFGDLPFLKPVLLTEEDEIRVRLSFGEAVSYMLSGGLALKLNRRLQKMTLGEYVRTNPRLVRDIMNMAKVSSSSAGSGDMQ